MNRKIAFDETPFRSGPSISRGINGGLHLFVADGQSSKSMVHIELIILEILQMLKNYIIVQCRFGNVAKSAPLEKVLPNFALYAHLEGVSRG